MNLWTLFEPIYKIRLQKKKKETLGQALIRRKNKKEEVAKEVTINHERGCDGNSKCGGYNNNKESNKQPN